MKSDNTSCGQSSNEGDGKGTPSVTESPASPTTSVGDFIPSSLHGDAQAGGCSLLSQPNLPSSATDSSSCGAASISATPGAPPSSGPLSKTCSKQKLYLVGNELHPSDICARRITKIFKEKMDVQGYCWKTVTKETRNFYWEEFQKYFLWDEAINSKVKLAWHHKAADRYRSMMYSLRKVTRKPYFVPELGWQRWHQVWNTEAFKARSKQFSANRRSETGGAGFGVARHTGGSISHVRHSELLAEKLGRQPLPHELFERTHRKNKGTEDFIDARSKSIHDRFLTLKESLSKPVNGTSKPQTVNETALFLQAVGGKKKRRVYGLGSNAAAYYTDSYPNPHLPTTPHQQEGLEEEVRCLRSEIVQQQTQMVQQQMQMARQQTQITQQQTQMAEQLKMLKERDQEQSNMLKQMQKLMELLHPNMSVKPPKD